MLKAVSDKISVGGEKIQACAIFRNIPEIPQNVGTKCEKGLKIRYSYYIKMGVKKQVWGKLLNKKVGADRKGRCKVGENLLNKKQVQAKFIQ